MKREYEVFTSEDELGWDDMIALQSVFSGVEGSIHIVDFAGRQGCIPKLVRLGYITQETSPSHTLTITPLGAKILQHFKREL